MMREAEADRFWRFVNLNGEGGCWLWTGSTNGKGYGQFQRTGSRFKPRAYVWAYEHLVGPVPEGLELDHLCNVKLCVRPEHLEPVTHRENTLRGTGPTAVNARKTHCPRGHEYDAANTIIQASGGRVCRACKYAWARAARARAGGGGR